MDEDLESQSDEEQAELLLTFKKGKMSGSNISLREKNDDFPLSALGLQRVGEKKLPSTSRESSLNLNRRGMPTRIRKKNKIYFDEDIVTSPSQTKSPKRISRTNSPKKPVVIAAPSPPTPSPTPPLTHSLSQTTYEVMIPQQQQQQHLPQHQQHQQKTSFSSSNSINSPDKKIAQTNGLRLRNFLKLPQAHKWVYFEWFYSNIDKPLFEGENDFQIVLKEAFPQLKLRKLSRRQWGLIRRMMGKPRRCSQAFFDEERQSLAKRRQVLRLLQQRKLTDINSLKELPLPSHIPMQLVVGTKVTARLRKPDNGLYTGIIDAVDTSDNTYRITFDRHGIGTHSIPDYEVLSNEGFDVMSLSSFSHQFRPRIPFGLMTPPRALLPKVEADTINIDSPTSLSNDPILAQSPNKPSKLNVEDSLGGFPVRSLIVIVTLSKILKAKKEKIETLKVLNEEAEKIRSFGQEVTLDFQRKYASLILEMENINRELNDCLVSVQQFCQEIAPDGGMPGPTLLPTQIRDRAYEEAAAIVDLTNLSSGTTQVHNPSIIDLITKLTSIMLQLKNITENEVSAFELTSLQESTNEIRDGLHESTKLAFQNNIEVHLRHVVAAVSQMGTLHAFNSS